MRRVLRSGDLHLDGIDHGRPDTAGISLPDQIGQGHLAVNGRGLDVAQRVAHVVAVDGAFTDDARQIVAAAAGIGDLERAIILDNQFEGLVAVRHGVPSGRIQVVTTPQEPPEPEHHGGDHGNNGDDDTRHNTLGPLLRRRGHRTDGNIGATRRRVLVRLAVVLLGLGHLLRLPCRRLLP